METANSTATNQSVNSNATGGNTAQRGQLDTAFFSVWIMGIFIVVTLILAGCVAWRLLHMNQDLLEIKQARELLNKDIALAARMRAELPKLRLRHEELTSTVDHLQAEKTNLQTFVEELQGQAQDIQSARDSARRMHDDLSAQNAAMQKQLVERRTEMSALEQRLPSYRQNVASLEVRIRELQQLVSTLESQKSEVERTNQILAQLKTELRATQGEQATAHRTVETLQEQSATLQKELADKHREKGNLDNRLPLLRQSLTDMEARSAALRKTISQLEQQRGTLEGTLAGQKKELVLIKQSIERLQSDQKALRGFSDQFSQSFDATIKDVTRSTETFSTQTKSVHTLLHSLEQELAAFKQQKDTLSATISSLRKEILDNDAKAQQQERELAIIKALVSNLDADSKALGGSTKDIARVTEIFSTQIRSLEQELATLKQQKDEFSATVRTLQKEVKQRDANVQHHE